MKQAAAILLVIMLLPIILAGFAFGLLKAGWEVGMELTDSLYTFFK